jgi:putative oxidoreductase
VKYVILAVRSVLGLAFLVFGLNYFLNFMPMSAPTLTPAAASLFGALAPTGYMTVVKVIEVTGGLLLLTRLFVPLGLVLLTPVIVNIALYDVLLMKQPGLGVPLAAMAIFLIWAYRAYFAPLFTLNAHGESLACSQRCARSDKANLYPDPVHETAR